MHTSPPLLLLTAFLSLLTLPGCWLDSPMGDGKIDGSTSTGTTETSADMPTTSGISTTGEQTTDAPPDESTSSTGEALTTTTTTSDESSSTTAPPSVCGDGLLEGDEQCDDGDANNGPGNSCTKKCMNNTCGDGELGRREAEQCDDGNLETGDLCSASCTRQHVVFVTKEKFTGALGGLTGADKICQDAAKNAQFLPPVDAMKFKAWLLVGTGNISGRFSVQLQETTHPIVTRNGDIVALNWTDLLTGPLMHPINVAEDKSTLTKRDTKWVWTNAGPMGNGISTFDCGQWNNSTLPNSVTIGDMLEAGQNWTQALQGTCNFPKHIYCFSQ
jgi:cysteine-rich repeat protein